MEVPFEGAPTKKDFFTTVRLAQTQMTSSIGLPWSPWLATVVWGLMFVASGLLMLLLGLVSPNRFFEFFLYEVAGLVIVIVGFLRHPNTTWNSKPAVRARVQGQVTDIGVEYTDPTLTEIHTIKWHGFEGYGEHQNIVALFRHSGNLVPFYETYFKTEVDWKRFKELVGMHLRRSHDFEHRPIRLGWFEWLMVATAHVLILVTAATSR